MFFRKNIYLWFTATVRLPANTLTSGRVCARNQTVTLSALRPYDWQGIKNPPILPYYQIKIPDGCVNIDEGTRYGEVNFNVSTREYLTDNFTTNVGLQCTIGDTFLSAYAWKVEGVDWVRQFLYFVTADWEGNFETSGSLDAASVQWRWSVAPYRRVANKLREPEDLYILPGDFTGKPGNPSCSGIGTPLKSLNKAGYANFYTLVGKREVFPFRLVL